MSEFEFSSMGTQEPLLPPTNVDNLICVDCGKSARFVKKDGQVSNYWAVPNDHSSGAVCSPCYQKRWKQRRKGIEHSRDGKLAGKRIRVLLTDGTEIDHVNVKHVFILREEMVNL